MRPADPENFSAMDDDFTGGMKRWLGGPCDLGPCTPSLGRNGRIFYSYDSQSSRIGEKSPAEQEKFKADYEQYRGQVCGLGIETGQQVAAWGMTGLGCGSVFIAPTPVNFGYCAIDITSVMIANAAKNRAEKNCKQSYPGKGKW